MPTSPSFSHPTTALPIFSLSALISSTHHARHLLTSNHTHSRSWNEWHRLTCLIDAADRCCMRSSIEWPVPSFTEFDVASHIIDNEQTHTLDKRQHRHYQQHSYEFKSTVGNLLSDMEMDSEINAFIRQLPTISSSASAYTDTAADPHLFMLINDNTLKVSDPYSNEGNESIDFIFHPPPISPIDVDVEMQEWSSSLFMSQNADTDYTRMRRQVITPTELDNSFASPSWMDDDFCASSLHFDSSPVCVGALPPSFSRRFFDPLELFSPEAVKPFWPNVETEIDAPSYEDYHKPPPCERYYLGRVNPLRAVKQSIESTVCFSGASPLPWSPSDLYKELAQQVRDSASVLKKKSPDLMVSRPVRMLKRKSDSVSPSASIDSPVIFPDQIDQSSTSPTNESLLITKKQKRHREDYEVNSDFIQASSAPPFVSVSTVKSCLKKKGKSKSSATSSKKSCLRGSTSIKLNKHVFDPPTTPSNVMTDVETVAVTEPDHSLPDPRHDSAINTADETPTGGQPLSNVTMTATTDSPSMIHQPIESETSELQKEQMTKTSEVQSMRQLRSDLQHDSTDLQPMSNVEDSSKSTASRKIRQSVKINSKRHRKPSPLLRQADPLNEDNNIIQSIHTEAEHNGDQANVHSDTESDVSNVEFKPSIPFLPVSKTKRPPSSMNRLSPEYIAEAQVFYNALEKYGYKPKLMAVDCKRPPQGVTSRLREFMRYWKTTATPMPSNWTHGYSIPFLCHQPHGRNFRHTLKITGTPTQVQVQIVNKDDKSKKKKKNKSVEPPCSDIQLDAKDDRELLICNESPQPIIDELERLPLAQSDTLSDRTDSDDVQAKEEPFPDSLRDHGQYELMLQELNDIHTSQQMIVETQLFVATVNQAQTSIDPPSQAISEEF